MVSKNKSKLIIDIGYDIIFSIAVKLRSKVRNILFAVLFFTNSKFFIKTVLGTSKKIRIFTKKYIAKQISADNYRSPPLKYLYGYKAIRFAFSLAARWLSPLRAQRPIDLRPNRQSLGVGECRANVTPVLGRTSTPDPVEPAQCRALVPCLGF